MNKVLKGLVAVAATAAMAVAGFAGASTAMAAENNYDITVPTTDTHTYSVYQVFTGDLSEGHAEQYQGRPELQQEQYGEQVRCRCCC